MSKKRTEEEEATNATAAETAENAQAEQHEGLTGEPHDPLAKLQEQYSDLNDKYLRLYSDFENFRRRTAKERLDLMKSAGEDVFKLLLPILDDFERARANMEKATDVPSVKEGVELIYGKMVKELTNKGLKPMETKGQPFDPEFHEAITQTPSPTDDLKGKVVDEVEKGYFLNEKVIRFAKVVVGA